MKAEEAMKILRITRPTLCKYLKEGKIKATLQEHNGQYIYDPASVYALVTQNNKINIIYARVSTHKQKNQLDLQIKKIIDHCNNHNIKYEHVYKDIDTGLTLDRTDFIKLIDEVIQYKIDTVYITNKDRITRYSFKMIEQLFTKFGTTICCVNETDNITEEEEILQELISIIHCFSMKTYSARRKKKMTLIKDDLALESKVKI